MKREDKILIIAWAIALYLQIGGQFGLIARGQSAYTVWADFDVATHSSWAFALTWTLIKYSNLHRWLARIVVARAKFYDPKMAKKWIDHLSTLKYNQWRYWTPYLMWMQIVIWEIVELTITFLHLMPPNQMFATPWNSFKDIMVGGGWTLATCFVWEMGIERWQPQ
jgi:hypothetical protein